MKYKKGIIFRMKKSDKAKKSPNLPSNRPHTNLPQTPRKGRTFSSAVLNAEIHPRIKKSTDKIHVTQLYLPV